uniref:Candidate secreted effector n=1 Tax=Meloidogyne incognita TaxID=6306 RepID=A0A914KTY0_MELIC
MSIHTRRWSIRWSPSKRNRWWRLSTEWTIMWRRSPAVISSSRTANKLMSTLLALSTSCLKTFKLFLTTLQSIIFIFGFKKFSL